MNPSRRLALIHAAEVARKKHAPVAHIDWELRKLTTQQLQAECPVERDWPTDLGVVLHELSHLASACAIVGCVLAAAAIYSGVK